MLPIAMALPGGGEIVASSACNDHLHCENVHKPLVIGFTKATVIIVTRLE